MSEIILDELLGEHVLDAVDFGTESVKQWSDCQVMRFRLDGKVYTAIEDPDDGYRSHCSKIAVSFEEMANVFPPVRVLVRAKERSQWCECDIVEMIDVVTTKTVVEVGTDNTDDYYPSFVASFHPENMVTNANHYGVRK